MLLPDLQEIAKTLGIKSNNLKKEELVYKILDEQAIAGATKKVAADKLKEERKTERQKRAKTTGKKENAAKPATTEKDNTPQDKPQASETAPANIEATGEKTGEKETSPRFSRHCFLLPVLQIRLCIVVTIVMLFAAIAMPVAMLILQFQLKSGMLDTQLTQRLFQPMLHLVHMRNIRHDHMSRQRRLGSTDSPNMQMMYIYDIGIRRKNRLHPRHIDILGHSIEGQPQTLL